MKTVLALAVSLMIMVGPLSVDRFGLARSESASAVTPIPYKSSPSPIEEHGSNVGLVLLSLIGLAGIVLYVMRRHMPKFGGMRTTDARSLHVVEKLQLNARCNLYVVRMNQREILIGQCGDNLVSLDATPLPPAPPANEDRV